MTEDLEQRFVAAAARPTVDVGPTMAGQVAKRSRELLEGLASERAGRRADSVVVLDGTSGFGAGQVLGHHGARLAA